MVREDSAKMAAWRGRIRRFESSALTVPQFCEREGVSRSAFYIWRKKVKEQTGTGIDRGSVDGQTGRQPSFGLVKFAPVIVSAAQAAVTMRLPGDVCLELPGDNLAALQAVVAEVMQQAAAAREGAARC
jgi:hypothetical protein